jgi:flagellar biogenesis protein FliO
MLLGAVIACAADKPLLAEQAKTDLGFPSAGRVVLGFLFTAGLAVAVAWALRRWWPSLPVGRATAGQAIRMLERSVVSPTLKVYLLEIDGTRFIVAESRSGVTMTAAKPGPGALAESRS